MSFARYRADAIRGFNGGFGHEGDLLAPGDQGALVFVDVSGAGKALYSTVMSNSPLIALWAILDGFTIHGSWRDLATQFNYVYKCTGKHPTGELALYDTVNNLYILDYEDKWWYEGKFASSLVAIIRNWDEADKRVFARCEYVVESGASREMSIVKAVPKSALEIRNWIAAVTGIPFDKVFVDKHLECDEQRGLVNIPKLNVIQGTDEKAHRDKIVDFLVKKFGANDIAERKL